MERAGATTRSATRLTAACVLVLGLAGPASAAELQPRTAEAYDEYAAAAERAFLERSRQEFELTLAGTPGIRLIAVRRDRAPSAEGRMVKVPGGVIHHWRGSAFISGVTLDQVLAVTQQYDEYTRVHRHLISSRLLGREGNSFRVLTRVREDAGGVSAVLDVWSTVEYQRAAGYAHSLGRSSEIRQVQNAGRPDETHLPAGRDSGYLWRAGTFTRFVERDGGVAVELETLGLSRGFPPLLGWVVEPIARRLGRNSIERSLNELRAAVLAPFSPR